MDFSKFVCLLIFIPCYILAIEITTEAPESEFDTEENIITTTEENIDLEEEDVNAALNVDVGVYTTMAFQYANDQYMGKDKSTGKDKCHDEFNKCLVSLTIANVVCAYHKAEIAQIFATYCHVFFDNCIRGNRYWLVIDDNTCSWLDNLAKSNG